MTILSYNPFNNNLNGSLDIFSGSPDFANVNNRKVLAHSWNYPSFKNGASVLKVNGGFQCGFFARIPEVAEGSGYFILGEGDISFEFDLLEQIFNIDWGSVELNWYTSPYWEEWSFITIDVNNLGGTGTALKIKSCNLYTESLPSMTTLADVTDSNYTLDFTLDDYVGFNRPLMGAGNGMEIGDLFFSNDIEADAPAFYKAKRKWYLGNSALKNINGIPLENIAKINGVPIENIKTYNGQNIYVE